MPFGLLLNLRRVRWTLGAQEICFATPYVVKKYKLCNHTKLLIRPFFIIIFSARSKFFSLGQVVPTVRGAGIYQPAMNFALDKLNEGRWVNRIFFFRKKK